MNQLPIPLRSKPKSAVVVLLVTLPVMVLWVAIHFLGPGWKWLETLATLLLACVWLLNAAMAVVYLVGFFSGRYDRMEARDWQDQVW